MAVSSLTGQRGIPSYAIYGASKFAVQGLYDALRLELRRDGVHVGVVSPGFIDTPLRDRVLGPDGKVWAKPPDPPFRIWPVEKCVDRLVRLILRRKKKALLPAFTGPLLAVDRVLGEWIGDYILEWAFPPDNSHGGSMCVSSPPYFQRSNSRGEPCERQCCRSPAKSMRLPIKQIPVFEGSHCRGTAGPEATR